ncbi:MAG: hypothetical protein ACYC0I_07270, partial [Acidimicrobiales bacterium]
MSNLLTMALGWQGSSTSNVGASPRGSAPASPQSRRSLLGHNGHVHLRRPDQSLDFAPASISDYRELAR